MDYEKTDRYGRLVGKVMLAGADQNLAQVSAGLAWHYKKYLKEQSPADQRIYADVEDAARVARRGLWQDAAPVPPWEWRHR